MFLSGQKIKYCQYGIFVNPKCDIMAWLIFNKNRIISHYQ